jgi:hypothetical protein
MGRSRVKNFANSKCRSLLCVTAGLLTMLAVTAGSTPALAQAADAADKCTPDVMRLCSEHIPDADRIVACLKAKRRQLSAPCLSALTPTGSKTTKATKATKTKKRHRTHHKAT